MGKAEDMPQHEEMLHGQNTVESGKDEELYIEDRIAALSEEHRQYLLARHGTLDLDPIPDLNDADPYNWPQWRVTHLPQEGREDTNALANTFEQFPEKPYPRPRRLPRHDRAFDCFRYPGSLCGHRSRPKCELTESQLLGLVIYRSSWWCTTLLAPAG